MMPLSKKRDKARKQAERTKIRLDRLLTPPAGSKGVQPKVPAWEQFHVPSTPVPDGLPPGSYIDADGNMVYE